MAVQGSVLRWVANHRRHHLYADKPGDVHSPHYDGVGNRYVSFVKGMMHAQGSWVFDHVATDGEYYARDILADPIAMFFVRTRWFWYGMSTVFIPGAIGYAVGGIHTMIGCVLFSGLLRAYVMTWPPRWSTRSAIATVATVTVAMSSMMARPTSWRSRSSPSAKGCTTTIIGFRGTPIFRTPGTKSTSMA